MEPPCLAGAWVRRIITAPALMGVPESVSSESAEPYSKYASATWTAISHDSPEVTFAFGSTPSTYRIHAVLCFHHPGSSITARRACHQLSQITVAAR